MTELDLSLEEQLAALDEQDGDSDTFVRVQSRDSDAPPATFFDAYPITKVSPAEYNPRFLSDDAFQRLQASLKRFGVVKPVILNLNDTIIAGHQRTKALTAIGAETVPAIQLGVTISTTDEIRFNLLHNSVEENGAMIFGPKAKDVGYHWLKPEELTVADMGRAAVRVASCYALLSVYGTWGSVVIDPKTGKVILNSDYAVACSQMRLPVLAYYPEPEQSRALQEALSGEYGIYDATQVQDKPYLQNVVQPNRLRTGVGGKEKYRSRVWDTLALPRMTKATRVLDFGAGKMDYVKRLSSEGWDVRGYEPFLTTMTDTGLALDLQTIVKHIVELNRDLRNRGLYDVIVLDSVLNATSTEDYHRAVLATCSALLAPTGVLCLGTRSIERQEDAGSAKTKRGAIGGGGITYLDPKTNRAINFKGGQFYTMRFHDGTSLEQALLPHFGMVEVEDTRNATILAVCAEPQPVSEEELRWALVTEFDPPYPEDYRHGRHERLVETIVRLNRETGRLL